MTKERYEKYLKICDRAEKMGICINSRINVLMDIESADAEFNLRLNDWMAADDFNFAHDFCGIQRCINRVGVFPANDFGLFVPRFAGRGKRK